MEYQAGQEEEAQGPQPKKSPQKAGQQAEEGAGDGEGPEADGDDEAADADGDEGPVNDQQGQVTTFASSLHGVHNCSGPHSRVPQTLVIPVKQGFECQHCEFVQ